MVGRNTYFVPVMQFTVRPMGQNDKDTMLAILKEGAEHLRDKGINQWQAWLQPQGERLEWAMQGLRNNEFYAVEDADGSIMAMYRLSYADELYWGKQDVPAGYIHSLTVRRAYAGRQLGQQILAYVGNMLKQQGYALLRLDCSAANTALGNYYLAQDFTQVGEVLMPHGLNNLYEKQLREAE